MHVCTYICTCLEAQNFPSHTDEETPVGYEVKFRRTQQFEQFMFTTTNNCSIAQN